jgi:solute carrier family 35 protein E1
MKDFILVFYIGMWYILSAMSSNIGHELMTEFPYPVTMAVSFGLKSKWNQFLWIGLLSLLIEVAGYRNLKRPTIRNALHILPLSIFQVLQQILSSIAISRIPVSLSHTIKATSPVITVVIYASFFNVSYSYKVYTALFPLTIGVMVLSHSTFVFDFIGISCSICSTVIFVLYNLATKKIFNQAAGHHSKYKMDKLNMLFFSAIQAWFLMIPVWFWAEGN